MDTSVEITGLLAELEDKLVELDHLRHDLTRRVEALALAARAPGPDRTVFAVPEAARELGISVSMVHKLLRQGRLQHLKIGARTLITPEQLAQFREISQVRNIGLAGAADISDISGGVGGVGAADTPHAVERVYSA